MSNQYYFKGVSNHVDNSEGENREYNTEWVGGCDDNKWRPYSMFKHSGKEIPSHHDLRLKTDNGVVGYTIRDGDKLTIKENLDEMPGKINTQKEMLIRVSSGEYRIHSYSEIPIIHLKTDKLTINKDEYLEMGHNLDDIGCHHTDMSGYWSLGKQLKKLGRRQEQKLQREWITTLSDKTIIERETIKEFDQIIKQGDYSTLSGVAREVGLCTNTARRYGKLLGYL